MTEEEQDRDISEALQSLLHSHYRPAVAAIVTTPVVATSSSVVQQLESKLGLDLSHKTEFIRAQIQQFLCQSSQVTNSSPIDHFAPQQTSHSHPPALHFPSNQNPETASAVSTKQSGPIISRRRGRPGGLTSKLCGVSPQLEAIVGQPALPRTEIVKQLWAYIRKNSLQDPNNRRIIICNDELRLVLETDSTDMFKMNKLLAKHIIPLEATRQSGSRKLKVDGESEVRHTMSAPSVAISEALGNFFGVGVREMLQSEVFTRLWQYINVNNLEDPLNPMVILCDGKLRELFGCESLSASRIPEVLASQHICRT